MEKGCICDGEKQIAEWLDGNCVTCKRELSKKDLTEWVESDPQWINNKIDDLKNKRNKLNRKIASLKKVLREVA